MTDVIKAPQIGKLLKKVHENKWVAFSSDYREIVDYADSLTKLRAKIPDSNVVYYRVFPADIVLAP